MRRSLAVVAVIVALVGGSVGLAQALGERGSAPAAASPSGQEREFKLTIGRIPSDLGSGRPFGVYAFNGQIPGPELRVTEGDTVSVEVVNHLDEPTSIHWHGVHVPADMDGAPQTSQAPIPPGGSFRYRFVASPAGTRWYHSHVNELDQQGGGLAGALIIEPREAPPVAPDRDYTLLAQAWSATDLGHEMGGDPMTPGHNSGATDLATNGQRPAATHTFNGKRYPDAPPLSVKEGELVRLRLINATTADTETFALAGHALALTHSDGNPLARPLPTEAVSLGVGERADVEFRADHPGRWQLRGFVHGVPQAGPAVDVVYAGHEGDAAVPQTDYRDEVTYADMAGPSGHPPPDRTYDFMLAQGAIGTTEWTINDKIYPQTVPIDVRAGEHVAVRFFNMSPQDHPMHLHGHSFQVIGIGDKAVDGPVKDTLTVGHMESYLVEFTADNPGRWLFHCHNLDHMMGGMMTEVRYPAP